MINPQLLQMLATERKWESVAAAAQPRLPQRVPRRLRQRFGRTLVGVGVRIARDSLAPAEGEHLFRRDPRPQRILVLEPRLERRPLLR
jgi:hypothetical protein